MPTNVIIGNAISLGAAVIMVAIGLIKNKDKILVVQCSQFTLYALANLVLGGFTGVLTNTVSVIRNVICIKWKFTTPMKIFFIILQVALAVMINQDGWYGWLPVIAAVSFTWFMDLDNDVLFKFVIIFGQTLWIFYDLHLMNYVSCAFDILTDITTTIGIILILKGRKEIEERE